MRAARDVYVEPRGREVHHPEYARVSANLLPWGRVCPIPLGSGAALCAAFELAFVRRGSPRECPEFRLFHRVIVRWSEG